MVRQIKFYEIPFRLLSLFMWYGYHAWKMPLKFVILKRKNLKTESPLSLITHFFRMMRLSYGYTLPPHYYLKYKLFNQNRNAHLLYYYKKELPYYHEVSNSGIKDWKASRQLIGDKVKFAKALDKLGIPTVPTLSIVEKSSESIDSFFMKKDLFCKPACGSQSINAFHLKYISQEGRYELCPIHGQILSEEKVVRKYLEEVITSSKEMLIQPFIIEHPEIRKLSGVEGITTFRIITELADDAQINVIYIQMEVPMPEKKNCKQFYNIVPLDITTFASIPIPHFREVKLPELHLPDSVKPTLKEAVSYCLKAHKELLNLSSVSFDCVITDNDPLIIEANFNWNVEMLHTREMDCKCQEAKQV